MTTPPSTGKKKVKVVRAWAIFDAGEMATLDDRMPIYWDKICAEKDIDKCCLYAETAKVIEVEMRPVKRKLK